MLFRCFSAEDLDLLYLSPYVKTTWNGDKELMLSQMMFHLSLSLHSTHDVLEDFLSLLTKGAKREEMLRWGELHFSEFSKWLSTAMLAGIVE